MKACSLLLLLVCISSHQVTVGWAATSTNPFSVVLSGSPTTSGVNETGSEVETEAARGHCEDYSPENSGYRFIKEYELRGVFLAFFLFCSFCVLFNYVLFKYFSHNTLTRLMIEAESVFEARGLKNFAAVKKTAGGEHDEEQQQQQQPQQEERRRSRYRTDTDDGFQTRDDTIASLPSECRATNSNLALELATMSPLFMFTANTDRKPTTTTSTVSRPSVGRMLLRIARKSLKVGGDWSSSDEAEQQHPVVSGIEGGDSDDEEEEEEKEKKEEEFADSNKPTVKTESFRDRSSGGSDNIHLDINHSESNNYRADESEQQQHIVTDLDSYVNSTRSQLKCNSRSSSKPISPRSDISHTSDTSDTAATSTVSTVSTSAGCLRRRRRKVNPFFKRYLKNEKNRYFGLSDSILPKGNLLCIIHLPPGRLEDYIVHTANRNQFLSMILSDPAANRVKAWRRAVAWYSFHGLPFLIYCAIQAYIVVHKVEDSFFLSLAIATATFPAKFANRLFVQFAVVKLKAKFAKRVYTSAIITMFFVLFAASMFLVAGFLIHLVVCRHESDDIRSNVFISVTGPYILSEVVSAIGAQAFLEWFLIDFRGKWKSKYYNDGDDDHNNNDNNTGDDLDDEVTQTAVSATIAPNDIERSEP